LRVGLELHSRSHDFRNQACRISDGDLEAAANVDDLANGTGCFQRRDEPRDSVSDVVEVTRRMHGAKPDAALPLASCVMIVGMNARTDCRGPYVLKGRSTITGVSNDL